MRKITILMIGLGRIGGKFYEQFSNMNPEHVEIIGVSEPNMNNPLLKNVEQRGIPNFPDFEEALDKYGEGIDIIMDTSNRSELKQAIRRKLQDTDNRHSVMVPMVVDYLMWYLLPGSEAIPQSHHDDIGY
ncbi:Gfo/Idh/MocA family oxidoreductase [Hydrogenovibrio halophilus]|uniref:NAD-binding homoserine dehydrogenase n=1 Tax=Hydrogenovibrio halophilus TaxID=373391 RepID=UPI00036C9A76|nr:NAD-binding homoserine dehydrogenase [Hydrogenovibrio halophilus]